MEGEFSNNQPNVKSWSLKYMLREEDIEADRIVKLVFSVRESLQLLVVSPFDSF